MKFPFDELNMCDAEHVGWVKSQRDPELWQSRLRTHSDRKCYHSARNKLPHTPLRMDPAKVARPAGLEPATLGLEG